MSLLSLCRINYLSSIKSTVLQCQKCRCIKYNPLLIHLAAAKSTWDRPRESFSKAKERLKNVKDKQLGFIRENIFTLPNALSTIRIAMTPALAHLVLSHEYAWSLVLFTVAGLTDVLDGYIARNYPGQRSALGSFLDPMADKLLVATLFISLAHVGLVPWPLASLIIFRDVLLIASAILIRYRSLPRPPNISKFFDVSLATAEIRPSTFSKFNTFSQLTLIFMTLTSPLASGYITCNMLDNMQVITALTTLGSGIDYLSFTGYRKYSDKLSLARYKRKRKN